MELFIDNLIVAIETFSEFAKANRGTAWLEKRFLVLKGNDCSCCKFDSGLQFCRFFFYFSQDERGVDLCCFLSCDMSVTHTKF